MERRYRMVHEDGSIRYVVEQSFPVRDADGTPYMVQGLIFDETNRKSAEELAFLAYHDRLTGLPNRQLFEEMLGVSLSRARRTNTSVAVLFVDLDHFKSVNDTLGHHAGDVLLTEMADRLRPCVRESDLVCRRSGDEFLVFLGDLDPVRDHAVVQAELVAERMVGSLKQPFDLEGRPYRGSASVGISMFPHDAHEVGPLLEHADEAMYHVKRHHRGTHAVWAGPGGVREELGASITARIRRAVEEQDWVLHWQPIVDLATGETVAAEGLIRWRDLSGGLVAPGDFLPLAEEMGLIEAIGDWVLQELCRQRVVVGGRGHRSPPVREPLAAPALVRAPGGQGPRAPARRRRRPPGRDARGRRAGGDGRPRADATGPARAPVLGPRAGDRRLRAGAVLARTPPQPSGRSAQDRPFVRGGRAP